MTIHPRISVSQISSFGCSTPQDLEFYRSSSIHTAGFLFSKLKPDVEKNIAAIHEAGLRASCVVAGEMPMRLFGAEPGARTALDILGPAIDAAIDLDAVPCYFTSGLAPSRMSNDDAYDALLVALEPVTAYAGSRGVRLAIENNSTATRDNGFIHTLADAVDLSKDSGIGICVELQNAWMERHLATLFKDNVERFTVVQVSDFVVGEPARLNRAVPGDGDVPLEWLLARVLDAGYTGLFEVEVLGPRVEEEGYAAAILRGVEWLNERLNAWGV